MQGCILCVTLYKVFISPQPESQTELKSVSLWLMSIFWYPMKTWFHTGNLWSLGLRAIEHIGGQPLSNMIQLCAGKQYWTGWWWYQTGWWQFFHNLGLIHGIPVRAAGSDIWYQWPSEVMASLQVIDCTYMDEWHCSRTQWVMWVNKQVSKQLSIWNSWPSEWISKWTIK